MISRFTPTLALLAVTLLQATPSHAEDKADLVLRHGLFYTVSSPGAVNGSLAVREGRIVYLGDDAGALALRGPKTRVVELGGRAVTPGLIDAHSHLAGLGAALAQVDLTGAATYEEVVKRMREAAAKLPAGRWIYGRGWDQNLWPGKQFPTHEALSAALPDRPAWLVRVDGHAALANAKALAALGIDATTKDPEGGRLLRDANGQPTGVLVDNAKGMAEAKLPAPSEAEREAQLLAASRHCLEVGLTTVTDMGIGEADHEAYTALAAPTACRCASPSS